MENKSKKEIFQYTFAALITIVIFSLLALLIFREVPQGNQDVLNIVIGAIIGSYITVVSYFFGSSKGSADKNDIIKNKQNG